MKKKGLFIIFLLILFSLVIVKNSVSCDPCDGVSICEVDYCCSNLNPPDNDSVCPSDFGDWSACDPQLCVTDDYDCCPTAGCGGSCWKSAGWIGDITEKCCGIELDEFYSTCISSDPVNVLDCTGQNDLCCDLDTDCVYNNLCYDDANQYDPDEDNLDEYCDAGTWTLLPLTGDCINGIECQSGLCVDDDYNGAFPGKCGACDTASVYDICGAIAHDGSVYGICTGAGGFYECYDQSNSDGDGFCIKNANSCDKSDAAGGGNFSTYIFHGTQDYIRCGASSVCNGATAMPWAGSNANADGSCVSVDSTVVDIITLVDDDATPAKISIADEFRIETFSTYTSFTGAPDWKWLFECSLDRAVDAGLYSDACNQNPLSASNQMASVDPVFVATGNQIKTVNFFSPQCDSGYIDAAPYKVDAVNIFTGYCDTNAWQTGDDTVDPNPSFTVVECEDNADAIAIANSQNGGDCDLSGTYCTKSYCNTTFEATHCPSNLDDTAGCETADEVACCSYYGYTWKLEGEDFDFGEYGDDSGNILLAYPDRGVITDDIAECCGDDSEEYLITGVAGTRCCNDTEDMVWVGKCHVCGTYEECDYTFPEGDCEDVEPDSSCYDGMDNDCDGSLDFCETGMTGCDDLPADSDCLGTISGTVYNASSGLALENAVVKIIQKSPLSYMGEKYTYEYTVLTDANGVYSVTVNGDRGEGRRFDVIASKSGFAPKTEIDAAIGYRESFQLDFTLEEAASNCRTDCTLGDNICHSVCDLWNDCLFFNQQTKESCDGKQPGFKVPYGTDQMVVCCEGSPEDRPGPAIPVGRKVKPEKEDVVRITKAVILDGEAVNMIIDIFG